MYNDVTVHTDSKGSGSLLNFIRYRRLEHVSSAVDVADEEKQSHLEFADDFVHLVRKKLTELPEVPVHTDTYINDK